MTETSIDKSCYHSSQETVDLMDLLLGSGADPNLCDRAGNTPLVHAAKWESSTTVECSDMEDEVGVLLRRGADPCIADRNGELPYDHAEGGERDLLYEAGGYRDDETGMCAGDARKAAAAEESLGLELSARRRVQTALAAQGFDAGAPDGLFGPRTRGAVRAWQAERGDGGAPSLRRCGASGDGPAQAAATGYLTRADVDALLAAGAAATTLEPLCAGMAEGAECWKEVADKPGCHVWDDHYYPGQALTWSGACSDRIAQGRGVTTWTSPDSRIEVDGLLKDGKMHGHIVVRSAPDNVWEGPYVEGKRHGLWVRRGAEDGWRCYRNGERMDDTESRSWGAPCVAEVDRAMQTLERVGQRAGPGGEYGELPGSIGEGVRVHATGQVGEWFRVEEQFGVAGFVHVSQLEEAPAAPAAGTVFRDCPDCPEMAVVPAGGFMMGSPPSEEGRYDDEGPVHQVAFAAPFAVGVFEVTFAEWDACVSAGGCGGYRPEDAGWGRGSRPVVNVSWDDAQSYVGWLSRATGEDYRLLSESEWEYVARAGTSTRYWWGDDIGRGRANCASCGSQWDDESTTDPVGSFAANAFGLHDVHGNVWEWTGDCWNEGYAGAPGDGRAWEGGGCSRRVLRGGSWINNPQSLRSANRGRDGTGDRNDGCGFRVARTLTP